MIRLICDKVQSLKEFTENNCAQASFAWNYLLKNKEIKINGRKTGENVVLSVGDEVQYFLTKKQEEIPAFFLVYEDGNILIADKESGVNSEAVFAAVSLEEGGRCAFIHRLDRNTRGLIAFAKNPEAEKELLAAFKERRVEKTYHALCFGHFERKTDVLTAYLQKDETRSLVRIFDFPKSGTEKIVTEYKVIEELNGMSKAEVRLHTGKTHQIRAHLAHIGHPIVGDMKYGDATANKAVNLARQQLVAKEISFEFHGSLAYLNGRKFFSRFEV